MTTEEKLDKMVHVLETLVVLVKLPKPVEIEMLKLMADVKGTVIQDEKRQFSLDELKGVK